MITVFCQFHLSIAHSLPNLPPDHKCARVHGHNYRVILEVGRFAGLDRLGWIVDYAEIAGAWEMFVHDVIDHRNVNEALSVQNSTSEFIADWIARTMRQALNGVARMRDGTSEYFIESVEVWETDSFGAPWRLDPPEP